jgi:hypothetical protein
VGNGEIFKDALSREGSPEHLDAIAYRKHHQ